MATLTGELISETYDSLLKVTDNNTITGVKKRITDGFGNEIPLQLSSTDIEIDGTLILSALTDLEAATKFLSLKADNSVSYRTASEVLSDIGGASSSSISGTTGNIAKFTSTGAVGNSILEEIGNAIHLTDGTSSYASFGIINPGIPGEPGVNNDAYIGSTINNDFLIRVNNTEALRIDTALRLTIANIQNATTDTDKFLVSDGGVVKYRTGAEVLADIGGASATGYVPYTGATQGLNLGTNNPLTLADTGSNTSINVTSSSSGQGAILVTKSGNGEGVRVLNNGIGAAFLAQNTSTGIGFYINNGSTGIGLRINNDTSAIGDPFIYTLSGNLKAKIDYLGNITGNSFIKSGGLSTQFLKADGSVDSVAYGTGSVTSVGLTMPVAFSVANSPITSSGTLEVTAIGSASQYIRGDGTLATIPSTSSGGANVNYYLNGSVAASVATYKQMDNSAVIGGGTDFNLVGNGLIAQFLTDAGNPNRLLIPGGAWNFEMYFNVSSSGGNSKFYVELLKYDGTTFTSIASSSAVPEEITGGTTTDLYITSLAVPETVLLITDRLALRVYIVDNSGGRTVTLHTEDNTLCLVTTTFAGGIAALNGLTANTQYFATGTTGSDFNISSTLDTHTFNLPTASATNRGALSSANWSTFNGKENVLTFSSPLVRTLNTISIPAATSTINGYLSSTDWSTFNSKQNTITLTTTGTSGAATFISNTLNIPQYTVLSLAAIGITPNANGASIVGSLLSLQPADASFGGVITTGAQTIAGAKSFNNDLTANGITIGRGGGNIFTNTGIGLNALFSNTTGSLNTAFGYQAGYGSGGTNANTTGLNNIFIGYNTVGESATENSRTWIGNASTTSTWLGGNLLLGSRTNATSDKLQVTGGATITGILKLGSADNAFVYESAGSLILQTGASARLTINSAGNTTISGALNGTSATFSGRLSAFGTDFHSLIVADGSAQLKLERNGTSTGLMYLGADNIGFKIFDSSFATRLTLTSSGNLGLGVTPSAWLVGKAIEIGNIGNGLWNASAADTRLMTNVYFDGTLRYGGTGSATIMETGSGFIWRTAPSGTAGNAITFTQAMTLTANGRLLINTPTESTYQLDVNGTGRFSGDVLASRGIFGTTGSGSYGVLVSDNDQSNVRFQLHNQNSGNRWSLVGGLNGANNTDFSIYDNTNNVTALRIVPVTGAATFSSSVTATQLDAYTTQGGSKIGATHGSGGTYPKASGISFGSTATSLSVSNNGGTTVFTGGAGIYANNTAASDNPTELIFWTTSGGSPASRLTIASTGAATLSNLAGTGSRAVLADATGLLSAPVSDISVKENIQSIGYGLNEIVKMNPVWFDFVDDYKNFGDGRQNGNIAQEMQKIIPEAVFTTPSTGKMGINYDQLHAVYIKAIQELLEKITQLENK